ncbi:MAG TPA: GDP-mannose 4,6-dehydratase [Chthoniobacterales bacterium]|jgi:GDPmannose 4,6-dehydratase|nr:GDP-mannose 4,6-dehydratase [Chthoniobacterales bacterium]
MPENKTALITGITGQDGSYLTELLLEKGYAVHGVVRRTSNLLRSRIEHLRGNGSVYDKSLFLHYGDLSDGTTLRRIFAEVKPSEIYHLAGQSHVGLSFEIPESTCEEVGMATLRLLEIARDQPGPVKFYHASSSEIFGSAVESPQTEMTPVRPASPYGCAKAFATQLARVYRESYGLFVCNGILYNHESPRRGENFVTRKIARAAARIARGLDQELSLGSLESRRDWGRAQDYVVAMWLMLQQDKPDDYVVATGETHSVRDFVEAAFAVVNLPSEKYVRRNPAFDRPSDPARLVGSPAKIKAATGWEPRGSFEDLVREMVEAELAEIDAGAEG